MPQDKAALPACLWRGCGKRAVNLIDHIHRRHVGVGLRVYICEWENCRRDRVCGVDDAVGDL